MQIIETEVILRELVADEGKILTNGTLTVKSVYLGQNEPIENWSEIDEISNSDT